jgi:hypothetical protein
MYTPSGKGPSPEPETSARQHSQYEADYFRRKAQASEAQMIRLQDEVSALKQRLRRVDELEQKLGLIMGHNTSLLEEVSELSALINAKNQKIVYLENQLQAMGHGEVARQSRAVRERQQVEDELLHLRNISEAES